MEVVEEAASWLTYLQRQLFSVFVSEESRTALSQKNQELLGLKDEDHLAEPVL